MTKTPMKPDPEFDKARDNAYRVPPMSCANLLNALNSWKLKRKTSKASKKKL